MLATLAEHLEDDAAGWGLLEAVDTGKPLPTAGFTVVTAVRGLRVGPATLPAASGDEDYAPFGVVAAFLPSNAPLYTAGIRIGAALLAGNAIVLKPPPEASLTVTLLARAARELGFPPGVVIALPGGAETGQALVAARPDLVSFTGGPVAGAAVAAAAGRLGIPVRAEMGGGAPVLVLAGTDLDAAVPALAAGAFSNQGQVCVAATEIFVDDAVHDEFVERFVARAESLQVGPAYRVGTEFGPVHTEERLRAIEDLLPELGPVLTGGGRPPDPGLPAGGWYLAPTVVAGPGPGTEVFGPVVFVARVAGAEEALTHLPARIPGLAAGVWGPPAQAREVGRRLPAGQVYVNCHFNPDPAARPAEPWAASGFGRQEVADHLRRRIYVGS
jgi:acyl-CoA reductase-like NAD-dependent aldehyde dehydrogenase